MSARTSRPSTCRTTARTCRAPTADEATGAGPLNTKNSKNDAVIVKNRRALFDYEIEDRYEAGLCLVGSEVKSLRDGKVDVTDAYVSVERGEAWLKQMYVGPLEHARAFPHETRRSRKLLLHGREIEALHEALGRGGYTAVPLSLYFKNGRVKVELGVGKGKKHYDKRAAIAKRDADRDARQTTRQGR